MTINPKDAVALLRNHEFLQALVDFFYHFTRSQMTYTPQRSVQNLLWEKSVQESADFIEPYLSQVMVFNSKPEMFSYTARLQNEDFGSGIGLEFGVGGGGSINALSRRLGKFQFFGFDSFLGLKEDWVGHGSAKGAYSQQGKIPKVNDNVTLIEGWFDETLPKFIKENQDKLRKVTLLHIDCDTYEATSTVFDLLSDLLKPGLREKPKLYILFDELLAYPGWRFGEFKALEEAKKKYKFNYKFRAFGTEQALIEITD